MKAMVLCAGYGSRLGKLTEALPKPLLRAGGHALVDHILANLRAHGFGEVMINLHHRAQLIRDALVHWERRGVTISFSEENTLLGTAGALKKVEGFFSGEEAFLVHYGDIVTDVDLTNMLEFHRTREALVTLLVHRREKSNSALVFDQHHCVREFVERPPEEFWDTVSQVWVNSGVMIVCPEVLKWVPDAIPSDWPRDIFPALIRRQGVYAHCLDGYRIAIDSVERLMQLEADIQAGRLRMKSEFLM